MDARFNQERQPAPGRPPGILANTAPPSPTGFWSRAMMPPASIPPGPGDHLVRRSGEGLPFEASPDRPTGEPRSPKEELKLKAINPTLGSRGAMGGGRPSGFIDFPNLDLGPLELGDRVFCPGVPHLHHPPGGWIPGLDLQGRYPVGLDPILGARVGHVEDKRPTWLKVLAETSQRPDLVLRRLAVGEAVEGADHPRIAARQRELSHVGHDRPLAPASPPGLGPETLDHRPAPVEPVRVR